MAHITNEAELLILMEQKVSEALNSITQEVLELFKKDYLRKYVYDPKNKRPSKPNRKYHDDTGTPTYQFEEAWEWTDIKKQLKTISTEMWFNSEEMEHDSGTFLHGSKYSSPNDVSDNLMDILNKTGYSSSLWLSVNRKIAYWDKFIADMFDSGKLGKIIEKHFRDKGFRRS